MTFSDVEIPLSDLSLLPLPEPVPLLLLRFLSAIGNQNLVADCNGVVTGAVNDYTYEMQMDLITGMPVRIAADDWSCSFLHAASSNA